MNSKTEEAEVPVRLGRAAVQANGAAAGLVEAMWDLTLQIADLPPRLIVSQMRDGVIDLHGDTDLPDHLRAAFDALEVLPEVILAWRAPHYYEGRAPEFLADAERVFINLTGRLNRLREATEAARTCV